MKKKILLLMTIFVSLLVLTACTEPTEGTIPTETFTATLLINDITLTKGESVSIDYQITPAGTFGVVNFEIVSSTPANTISITGTTLTALEVGTASVKATATHMPGASKTFSTEKTFTITVQPIPVVDGEFIKNGGFEFGVNEWTVVSPFGADAYGTTVVNNYPHSGEAALNLWYDDNANELSEPVDLIISQSITALPVGTYLFQLWYQGTMDSIKMTIKQGTQVLVERTFSGYDYQAPANHDGYVNYGIELVNGSISDLTVEVHVIGAAESWGYLDDISFKLGTEGDLIVVAPSGEEGYINFINGGNFTSLTPWTLNITGEATSKQASLSSGRLSIWANGAAEYRISQHVTLIEEVYNMAIYLNGGVIGTEFNVDLAYIYVKQGETLHKIDLTPEGWNQGVMKRIELSDISLSGEVEIGIYINFTGGSNNWINLDDFVLWSYELPLNPQDITAAAAVDALIQSLPALNELTLDDASIVASARTAYDALTTLQKSFVTQLDTLAQLEAKLIILGQGDTLAQFNQEGQFESTDWSLATINWISTGGNQWVTDWGYAGEKSYNPYKDQANELLVASIHKDLVLEAGTYQFSVYLAGSGVTVTVFIGDQEHELIVTSGSYTLYGFNFVVEAGTFIVKLETERVANGWLHMDDVKIETYQPSALEIFNHEGLFESDDTWLMSSVNWVVTGGNNWTTDWGYESAKSYNPYKDQANELLIASISKTLELNPGSYQFSIYLAGGDVSIKVTIGGVEQVITVTAGSYTLYQFDFTLVDASSTIVIESTRATGGWLHMDSVSIVPMASTD